VHKKLIFGAIIGLVVLGSLGTDETPEWIEYLFGVVFAVTIVGLIVFALVSGTGWRALATAYPERTPYSGEWYYCRTFQMIALHSGEPFSARFSGSIVAVGTTSSALYISMPRIVSFLLPTIELPWTAIESAKPFEAPGWVNPIAKPGMIFQVEYDPGFRGEFVELETKEPKVVIRLSMQALQEARSYLPLPAAHT
jgi:hypothetical protein